MEGVSSVRLTGLDSGHTCLTPPSRGDHSVRIWGLLTPGRLPHIFKVPSLTLGVQASRQHFVLRQLQPSYKPRAPGSPLNIRGPLFPQHTPGQPCLACSPRLDPTCDSHGNLQR